MFHSYRVECLKLNVANEDFSFHNLDDTTDEMLTCFLNTKIMSAYLD